jgi:YD repeat-containing protein
VVNLGNGNLCLQIPLTGWANGVSFSLVFNSQANPSQPSPIAPKWTHNWHVFLTLSSTQRQATVQEGDGSRWVYNDPDGDGVFTAPTGVFDRLVRQSDGRYVLTRRGSEERWVFASQNNAQGMCVLERVEDKYARAVVLSYVNGRLSQITDRYGRALSLTYTNNRLWQVVDFTGRVWDLMYDGQGRLQKVRFPAVQDENNQSRLYEITLGYNSRGNVIRWTDRRGQTWQYEYLSATSDVLKWFRDPAGNQWTASYSNAVPVGIQSLGTLENGSSRWTDPTGVWVEYGFAAPTVVRLTQGGNATPLRLTTRLWYNGQYQVIKRQDSAGLVWEWNYDPQGNLLWSKEPNGAQTSYTYYPNSDRVWKVTDALNHTWEYTYTDVGDVKSVKDPENAATSYVYDYELNEPAYGQVRRVIDPLGRTTEYQYYAADEANWARRGQVKKVIAPGGYWREMDYGGAGWLTRRTVQTGENSSETTLYSYDTWGRLRGIDYPRSADVSMGWDGENRRVWVQDGAGRREYTYDVWGRVREQRGCCGSGEGIEVVAVAAQYDEAGRKRFEKELRADGSVVRTIESTYDALGRLQSIGDYRGTVVYTYDNTTGRLKREDYPNGSYVEYTYYGANTPSQVGFVWKVEHKKQDGSLLIGYEYSYDLLGRVEQSVERPRGDVTAYTYTPAGRLESEGRTGQVAYSRTYAYRPDGSRDFVIRDDAVNGSHWDVYDYDAVSGRLTTVQDVWTGEENRFVWNPEGTLARWESNQPNSYARVFGYDEEGRLVRIERDYGNGNLQLAYVYGYNSDGVRVWKQDVLSQQEYRYVCRIGCGGVIRTYKRELNNLSLQSENYISTYSSVTYYKEHKDESFVELRWIAGHMVFETKTLERLMIYKDRFGVQFSAFYQTAVPAKPVPPYYLEHCPPPDVPPPFFFPFPLPDTPPNDSLRYVFTATNEPRCSGSKPIVPKTDPAYECYRKACERWWKREQQIDHYEQTVCSAIGVCAFMNWALPPIDKNLNPDRYDKCYSTGGAEGIFGYTAILGCCVECGIRVCFWITQPEREVNEARLRLEWKKCTKKFHAR